MKMSIKFSESQTLLSKLRNQPKIYSLFNNTSKYMASMPNKPNNGISLECIREIKYPNPSFNQISDI